ncbi:MAG: serine hydrolase domain-containing protein [Bacteroidota bacterium]
MKQTIILSFFIVLLSCQVDKSSEEDSYSDLVIQIDSIVNEYEFNGVISLSDDKSNIYFSANGFSDLENNIPMKRKDQFVIGSISKQITAVLVLQEFEMGTIKLYDTIENSETGSRVQMLTAH